MPVLSREATTTVLSVERARGVYGGGASLSATLRAAGAPARGRTISFSLQNGLTRVAVTNGAGVAKLKAVPLADIAAGTYAGGVTATFAGDAGLISSRATADLIVERATPSIDWPTPSAITYGTALGPLQLNATTSVPGTMAYAPQANTVLTGGVFDLQVLFTPNDARNYTTASARVRLKVIRAAQPPEWDFKLLAQPAVAKNILAGLIITDRRTGREALVLTNNNEGSGMELIFVDIDRGTAEVFRAPVGAGAEGLTEVPGDRLALGTFYDGDILIFDLNRMAFVRTFRFPGEQYVWGFVLGNDGRLYAGSFPGGKLGAIDLTTYALEDLGAPALPNTYLRSVSPTPDGRVFCSFIAANPLQLIFDPQTRRFQAVPEQLVGIRRAKIWNGYFVARRDAYQSRDLHRVAPSPFPLPDSAQGDWEIELNLTTADVLYIKQSNLLWRYRKGDERLSLVASVELRGGRLLAASKDGRIFGYRGQDYFIIKEGDTALDLRAIPGPSAPRAIQFLRVDPFGRVWGGPPYGQTLFWMNPLNGMVVTTPAISDMGGQVYDVAFRNGITYAAAYYGGEIIRYDPLKPFDQFGQNNPKTIASFSWKGYIRPTGGIILGPGQKLYSGWQTGLGTEGGALAITDPDTGASELLENPLGVQGVTGVVTDGKILYVGTGLSSSGLPLTPGRVAQLGIIDPESKKVLWQESVPFAWRVRPLGYDAKTRIVPVVVNDELRLFNTVTRTFTDPKAPPVGSWANAVPGDGKLYYASGRQVLVLDLQSGETGNALVEAPSAINNVTRASDGSLYVGVWTDLYFLSPVRH